MRTYTKMHDDCNKAGWPCDYWGEYGAWLIVLGRSRDSDSLEEHNFQEALKQLGGESDTVAVERSSHWAVGWVETLLVKPDSEAQKTAETLLERLDNYLVLNEDNYNPEEY